MSLQPRAAFGVPVYNHAHQLEESLESILTQSYRDFCVVAVDDCSTDETSNILARYAARDPRLIHVRNERRLGYTENARKAYQVCRAMFPSAEFFCWGSDHDLWHPHWLRLLVDGLDAEPDAVAAVGWSHRISDDGEIVQSTAYSMEAPTLDTSIDRVRFSAYGVAAGGMIYGLMRVSALEKTSGLRLVIAPDRLLLAELSIFGRISIIPEYLWYRRYFGLASRERQRRNSFPGWWPLHSYLGTYLPIGVQHGLVLMHDYVIRRRGGPHVSRLAGCRIAYAYVLQRKQYGGEREQRRLEGQARQLANRAARKEKRLAAREARIVKSNTQAAKRVAAREAEVANRILRKEKRLAARQARIAKHNNRLAKSAARESKSAEREALRQNKRALRDAENRARKDMERSADRVQAETESAPGAAIDEAGPPEVVRDDPAVR